MKSSTTLSPRCALPPPSAPTRFTPTQYAWFSMARARSKRRPRMAPRRRPVGRIDDDVIVELGPAPAPDRETQVVTHERAQPDAAEFDDQRVTAGAVVPVLAAHAEQVPLVIPVREAVRHREHETIEVAAAIVDRHAAADGRIEVARLREQPRARLAVGILRVLLGLHREAGGEHLGQHHEIRLARKRREHLREVRAIRRRVVPDERLLREGDAERHLPPPRRVHAPMRAAASMSVASRLATHSRTMRMSRGGSR